MTARELIITFLLGWFCCLAVELGVKIMKMKEETGDGE